MSIQERLQLVLKMHNLTASAFADKMGVQRSNVSHVLSGRNKPSLDFLEKIVIHFPRVNAHWLITGKMPAGQSLESNSTVSTKTTETTATVDKPRNDSKKIEKIVEFYSDNTFTIFTPSKQ